MEDLHVLTASPALSFERNRSFSADGLYGKRFIDSSLKYSDWNATSMGVNRSGRLAVLAARRGFLVVDFDTPATPRKVNCNHKMESSSLEWNPHIANENLFASVMNQKVEVWNVEELSSGSPSMVLSGHSRAISDINWNYFDPNTMLTCSMDTYINLWDIRQTRKPSSTFTTVAGSSQVKWNKRNKNLFASAHDGDVRVWDVRKGNIPAVYIAGHLSKIHGLDWSPQNERLLVTASNDCMVKFWSIDSPLQPQGTLNNRSPVWKARYTPFGNGLVTILVPQIRRGDNIIYLWNTTDYKTPVHKFNGHTDVILEFHWRTQNIDGEEDYQLVSWSKDLTLRTWRAAKKIVQAITGKYDKSSKHSPTPTEPVITESIPSTNMSKHKRAQSVEKLNLSLVNVSDHFPPSNDTIKKEPSMSNEKHRSAFYRVTSSDKLPSYDGLNKLSSHDNLTKLEHRQSLKQEFSLINWCHPIYKVDMDVMHRYCIVTGSAGSFHMKLTINFPSNYPYKTPPQFSFSKNSKLNPEERERLSKVLEEVAQHHVKFNRPCLDPVLRKLVLQVEEMKPRDVVRSSEPNTPLSPPPLTRLPSDTDYSYQDSTVPFPRTCGARFCGVGDRLVVFARPAKFTNITIVEKTLRSLSALHAHFQKISDDRPFDPSVYNENGPVSFKQLKSVGLVYISDTSKLLPLSKELANSYVLNGADAYTLCLKNAQLASNVRRTDLVNTWSLLAQVLHPRLVPRVDDELLPVWSQHPFGRKLVESLFNHYERVKDVQTLAMMACVLEQQQLPEEMINVLRALPPEDKSTTPLSKQRVDSSDGLQVSPEFPYTVFNKLSAEENSWSPIYIEEKTVDPQLERLRKFSHASRLLDTNKCVKYDQYKRSYANLLYRWQYNVPRAEIMKFVQNQPPDVTPSSGLDVAVECLSCKVAHHSAYCRQCKTHIVKCSVCRLGVRGLLSFCMMCGHGGHMFHLLDWFRHKDWCATGCGCYCLQIGKFTTE